MWKVKLGLSNSALEQQQPSRKDSGRMPGVEKDVKNMTEGKKGFGEKVGKVFAGFIKTCSDAFSAVTGSKRKSVDYDYGARLESKRQEKLEKMLGWNGS